MGCKTYQSVKSKFWNSIMEGCRVSYYFTGALIILLCSLAFCVTPAYPNTTQNNTSDLTHQSLVVIQVQLQILIKVVAQIIPQLQITLHQQVCTANSVCAKCN